MNQGMRQSQENTIISFVSRQAVVDIHYHNCFQIVVSIGSVFECRIDGQTYAGMKGFVINQKIRHSCNARDTSVLVILIDAETYLGWQLKEMLGSQPFLDMEKVLAPAQMAEFATRCHPTATVPELKSAADDLLESILPSQTTTRAMDERIQKALDFIDRKLSDPISLEDVSQQIFLSPERTRHLFVQETGSPFSQYILWHRIKRVIISVLRHEFSFADAAVQFGFTDQAHFSRVFKRMFGTSAAPLLKNSRFIQFLSPEV